MKDKDIVISIIRRLHAVEVLEYEDKNWLSGDDKSRSEMKQNLLQYALDKVNKLKI